jgi:hypothetical protein
MMSAEKYHGTPGNLHGQQLFTDDCRSDPTYFSLKTLYFGEYQETSPVGSQKCGFFENLRLKLPRGRGEITFGVAKVPN